MATDPLFQPWRIGEIDLKHRIALAPLTRRRADLGTLSPNELMALYYEQRASDGGLMITEATYVSEEAGGLPDSPGCYNDEHVKMWREVVERCHKKGAVVFLQVWALGRANKGESGIKVVSSGDVSDPKTGGGVKPTPLSKDDIKRYVAKFARCCKLAREAGIDGVELHGAHGYLIDQFTQATCNNRTDNYGGSIDNRCRFALEVLQACADAIGEERLGIRLSPYSHFQGMYEPDHSEVFTRLCTLIHQRFPRLGYVHMVESRGDPAKLQNWAIESADHPEAETLHRFRAIFEGSPTAFLSAGGYTPKVAREVVKQYGGSVVFGRHFISNPDLPYRIQNNLPLAPYDRSTFYTRDRHGYTTYPAWSQPATPQNQSKIAAA